MRADDLNIDPELEGLLRQVASDPRATMLRIQPRVALRSVIATDEIVRPFATDLATTERELVRVHREQLAHVLLRACLIRVYSDPRAQLRVIRHVTPSWHHAVPRNSEWRDEARRALRCALYAPEELSGLELIDACLAADGIQQASIAQLAAASRRLRPTSHALIYLAVHEAFDGDARLSGELCFQAIARDPRSVCAKDAWANLGSARSELGEFSSACDAFEKSLEFDPTQLLPNVGLFIESVRLGRLDEALATARRIETLFDAEHPATRDFVAMTRRRLASEAPRDREFTKRALQMRERLQPTTRMLIDAYAQIS